MLSWKIVLACIISLYLALASAISLTVQYLAITPLASTSQRGDAGLGIPLITRPQCSVVQDKDATALRPAEQAITSLPQDSWDFSSPDDVPSYETVRPCEASKAHGSHVSDVVGAT
jgi:hypothetical protein